MIEDTNPTLFMYIWSKAHADNLPVAIGEGGSVSGIKAMIVLHPIFVKEVREGQEKLSIATLPYIKGFAYADERYLVYTGSVCNKVYGALLLLVPESKLAKDQIAGMLGLEECKVIVAAIGNSFSYIVLHRSVFGVDVSLEALGKLVRNTLRESSISVESEWITEQRTAILPINNYEEEVVYSKGVRLKEKTGFEEEYYDFVHNLMSALLKVGGATFYLIIEPSREETGRRRREAWKLSIKRLSDAFLRNLESAKNTIIEDVKRENVAPPRVVVYERER